MDVELYLSILLFSTICTILLTEGLKKLLNMAEVPYRSNAVALDSAMVCGTLVSIVFKNLLNLGLSFSISQIIRLLLVILSTWITSMFAYDKALQTIEQYKRYKEKKNNEK